MQTVKPKTRRFTYFVGIDVSKNTLDYAIMYQNQLQFHHLGVNDTHEILTFITSLKSLPKFSIGKTVFCMEHTGFYGNHLLLVLKKLKANVVQETPLVIKCFMGADRGKSDKADAIKIAEYAQKNKDELNLWTWRRPVVDQLSSLYSLRNRLLTIGVALKTSLAEQKSFVKKGLQKQNAQLCSRSIESVDADLAEVDKSINFIVKNDEYLNRLMALIISVPNVGRVTALKIMITTNEFRDINDPKKFACYAGVAPFKKESGQSTKRGRVSDFANKRMKSLLHICALSASKHDPEIRAYYIRKTEKEGKHKLAVLNAIRYKLIVRVFACVRQNRAYEISYTRNQETAASEFIICKA